MSRPHCGHLQANIYRLSAVNVRTVWDPIVCTIVMCVICLVILSHNGMASVKYSSNTSIITIINSFKT